jgi:hypothetical protein
MRDDLERVHHGAQRTHRTKAPPSPSTGRFDGRVNRRHRAEPSGALYQLTGSALPSS